MKINIKIEKRTLIILILIAFVFIASIVVYSAFNPAKASHSLADIYLSNSQPYSVDLNNNGIIDNANFTASANSAISSYTVNQLLDRVMYWQTANPDKLCFNIGSGEKCSTFQ